MKLAIERAALLKSLAHVQSVVERRTTIPILSNVKLEAEGGGLALTATDMDLSVVEQAEAEVSQPGATTAPAHTLYDVVRKLPEGCRVSLERAESGAEITLRAGRSTFDLPCLPAADFPAMSDEGLDHRFAHPGRRPAAADRSHPLRDLDRGDPLLPERHLPARASRRARPAACAASPPTAIAWPGSRPRCREGAEGMPPVIVPRKTVGEVRKLIDELECRADGRDRAVDRPHPLPGRRGGAALAPDRRHLPRLPAGDPERQRQAPARADQALVRSGRPGRHDRDREGRARSSSASAEGRLTLSAISPDAGRAVEELDVSYASEPLEIGFNARYILDMNSQIEGDEVELAMADAGSPTLVRDPKDSSTLYVLMPMRV